MFFDLIDFSSILDWSTNARNEDEVVLLFVAAESQEQLPELLQAMQRQKISCLGGVFSKIIYGLQTFDSGCVAARLKVLRSPMIVRDLDQPKLSLSALPPLEDIPPGQTLAIFADADAPYLGEFLDGVYRHFGNRVQYFGGGAGLLGELTEAQKQCVFTSEAGLAKNAAVLAFIDHSAAVGARHGWKRLHGPLLATRAEGNVLYELNWQPAFEVYRQVVEQVTGQPIKPEDVGTQNSLGFPFGVLKQDSEDLVRLPIAVNDDGGMVVVGGVHSNCVLHILEGSPELVLEAAKQTVEDCTQQLRAPANHKIVIDCVTRYWFLGGRYPEELNAIAQGLACLGQSEMMGVLSKGEVASAGLSYLEMLNKSIAVGAFA